MHQELWLVNLNKERHDIPKGLNVRQSNTSTYYEYNDNDNDNDDNDNDNILFDHNLQIEITIYNSLENQIINTLVWRLLLRQNNLSLA